MEYPDDHGNGWREWSKYVLKEMERLNACYDQQTKIINKMVIDIAMLKVKAGVWGALGGAVSVAIGIGVLLLKSKGK